MGDGGAGGRAGGREVGSNHNLYLENVKSVTFDLLKDVHAKIF